MIEKIIDFSVKNRFVILLLYIGILLILVTTLQRGNDEKILAAHGFNHGKNEN